MGYQDLRKQKPPFKKSLSIAFFGLLTAFKQERNIRIHTAFTLIVLGFGWFFTLSYTEWMFVLMAIGGTISLELMNSSIERTVDLVTKEYHPLAKQAKDIAAAAVLVFSIISVLIGLIIFLPKVIEFLGI